MLIEATLTMLPRPAATIRRPTAWQNQNGPSRLIPCTRRQSSGVRSSAALFSWMPAAFTSCVGSPSAAAARSTNASTAS